MWQLSVKFTWGQPFAVSGSYQTENEADEAGDALVGEHVIVDYKIENMSRAYA